MLWFFAAYPGAPAEAAYTQKTLAIAHFQQNKTNWCWAAAAKVVINYLTGTAVSQCALVDSQIALPTGCPNNGGAPYQVENIVDSYLASRNKGADWDTGWATSAQLKDQIDSYEPIVVDVKWKSTGDQHMFTAYGYDSTSGSDEHVYVSNYTVIVGTGTSAKREVHNLASFSNNTKHEVLRWMRIVSA